MSKNKNLRDRIKSEYKQCALDPSHFLCKYAVIQHPIKGKIKFNLYPFQRDVLHDFMVHQNNIVLKARQIGLSTLVAGYSLWLMLFHSDQNILIIATKRDVAKNLVTKVRIMHSHLPIWLRGNITEDNKMSLSFENGSQIKAIATSEDAGRSEALSLLVLDEAAHIDPPSLAHDIWTAAQPTLSTGGKAIILSSPNGMGNFFHKTWVAAENGENEFHPTFLHWSVHPERDQAWRDAETKRLGELEARQEYDADFIATGNTVINGDLIQEYRKEFEKEPLEKTGFGGHTWVWEYPDYTKQYVVVADVARGDGSDYSAFHVLELESVSQVAEYKAKIDTKNFAHLLMGTAMHYNKALLVVENSTVGWAVLQEIIDNEYPNLFYMTDDLKYVDPTLPQLSNRYRRLENKAVPGFTTSNRTRPLIISKLDQYMRDKSVVINSKRTYDELEVFIWNNGKGEAMEGYNDDLVIALSIGLWIRDTALLLHQKGIELTKSTLDHFGHSMPYEAVYSHDKPIRDPYRAPVNQRTEDDDDLRWLL